MFITEHCDYSVLNNAVHAIYRLKLIPINVPVANGLILFARQKYFSDNMSKKTLSKLFQRFLQNVRLARQRGRRKDSIDASVLREWTWIRRKSIPCPVARF